MADKNIESIHGVNKFADMKHVFRFLVLVYLFNIIGYFGVLRNHILGGINRLANDPAMLKRCDENGIAIDDLRRNALQPDSQIFNPLYNYFYAIGNVNMIVINVIIGGIFTYLFHRMKNNSISKVK